MNARDWFYGQPGFHNYPVTGETVRKADAAMARRERGQCDTCERQNDSDESGSCSVCRAEGEA